MAIKKKKLNKKVKQVASRAKAVRRMDAYLSSSEIEKKIKETQEALASLDREVDMELANDEELANEALYGKDFWPVPEKKEPPQTVFMTGLNENVIEFSPAEPHEVAARNAIERSKKVDLNAAIISLISTFKADINARLSGLSGRIEAQLKPLVQTVADIAVAKKDMEGQLTEFGARLSATLNLNDELEPIEIGAMFAPNSVMDEEMLRNDDGTNNFGVGIDEDGIEGMELLVEATEFADKDGPFKIN